MASEYLKRKYQDVKPEPKRELTPAEKRKNWWHYHWQHLLIAAAALLALGGIVWEQVTRVEPDCCIALVTRYAVTPEETAALRQALEGVCPDTNGDGRVSVAVSTMEIDYTSASLDEAAVMAMTANVEKLNADFYTMQSGIFLLDDPENFQKNHQALCYLDGSEPPEGAADWENMTVPFADGLAAGMTFLNLKAEELYFARRAAVTPEEQSAFAGANALWDAMF